MCSDFNDDRFLLFSPFERLVKLPQMKLYKSMEEKNFRFFVQNIGMITGFAIMTLLAIYEEEKREKVKYDSHHF